MPDLDAVYPDARPYTRWWWFSGAIDRAHVRAQLDWARANGFGGVEMAWVYPQPGAAPGPTFLGREWSQEVAAARGYASSIGLGCDLTFGTLWPFGGSFVSEADSAHTFGGPSAQRLHRSWEQPHAPPGRILDHLNPLALGRYAERVGAAIGPALAGRPAALFCDSWEVQGPDLWTSGFGAAFRERFGYDIEPYMADLGACPPARYDYRQLLADQVLDGFYRPFTEVCHRLGAVSRVQCHGSPTDLLAAYGVADVPESEAVLFDPHFSRLAASAASLAGRRLVSAEAFTCLYGWEPYPGPGPHQGEERLADLRLCADALLANGVNLLVWHGMPLGHPGQGLRFYASVHVGPDAPFADGLGAFNAYLANVCGRMRLGSPSLELGVYLPLEDASMRGELPPELQRPSAMHHWEMHYAAMPPQALGYRPVWVGASALGSGRVEAGRLRCGALSLGALYVDAAYLDIETVRHIARLAQQGLPVCLKRRPRRPGLATDGDYASLVDELLRLPTVVGRLADAGTGPPFLSGADLPEFWCREHDGGLTVFVAHPDSRSVTYPMRYAHAERSRAERRMVTVNPPWPDRGRGRESVRLDLEFPPGQSLLVRLEPGRTAKIEALALEGG